MKKFRVGQSLYTTGGWFDFLISEYRTYSIHHYIDTLIVGYTNFSPDETTRPTNSTNKRVLIKQIFKLRLEIRTGKIHEK